MCSRYLLIDVYKFWSGSPLYFPGMNSILLYIGHEMVDGMIPWTWAPISGESWQFISLSLFFSFSLLLSLVSLSFSFPSFLHLYIRHALLDGMHPWTMTMRSVKSVALSCSLFFISFTQTFPHSHIPFLYLSLTRTHTAEFIIKSSYIRFI